jgi:hypothetical protein
VVSVPSCTMATAASECHGGEMNLGETSC